MNRQEETEQPGPLIAGILKKITECWLSGKYEELGQYFHPDIVVAGPDFTIRAQGREACIESYRDFSRDATVEKYLESEPDIAVFPRTAIAGHHYEIVYAIGEQRFHETGSEVFVFSRTPAGWKAVWRAVAAGAPPQDMTDY
ncbi:MAG: nuclear transport factor 2 family protein [Methanomicrobiales archaeon]|nr:nuclear transport factor 2 family protein [Methanomicrobiales archaeon]